VSTCTAKAEPNLPAATLWWAHAVRREDVAEAFRDLNNILNAVSEPIYVFVDLRERPNFPLADTLRGALDGPFKHPMLKEWLVIGSSPTAHTIGRILSSIARRNNIKWFNTQDEATDYLQSMVSHLA
jgi:hypothetical protein